LSSAFRAGSSEAPVALAAQAPLNPELEEELEPYVDALVDREGSPAAPLQSIAGRWVLARPRASGDLVSEILRALAREPGGGPSVSMAVIRQNPQAPVELTEADSQALGRLQAYWSGDVSRDPTATPATRPDGSAVEPLRFFDGKKFTPILFLPRDPAGTVRIELSGGPFVKASVENLATGAKRDFDLKGAAILDLDLSRGALAAVLQPAERPGGETRTRVEVGAERGLTAEEIVARERAWDAGQRALFTSYIAHLKTSLRFKVGEVGETFDLSILGPLFYRRGEPADWEWDEFYLNGVKWKGKTLPKLPILQPEKVTAIPLDIRLTEDYEYTLKGEGPISGRPAYHVAFAPKQVDKDKATYRGSVWIDKETFALLRRNSVQMNLKGETLSAVQTEYYSPVPGKPELFLPLEIKGEEVYSTAGRTTAIERDVKVETITIDPPDFETLRTQAYASPGQMIRHTDRGMRYLVPDPAKPGERVVEEKISKKSTFGVVGAFYDDSLDYPIPLIGVQHFNFDLWGKGKQLSVFFAGALLTANYTDPALLGTHFDLGADLFGVAFPFGDVSYRNGVEVPSEKIKHLPAAFQVNVGHPIGPYLKASLGLFTKWDNFQRDKDTGPNFVTPVDTFTNGAELRLVANFSGFNIAAAGSAYFRQKWEFWGDPATSEFNPDQKDYQKWSVSVAKDQYFPGFRKLHLGIAYLGGHDLDRFSKYE
ncbi:MAG TPA: sigma-E factor regulatory protein RseB domain-containing protein, partial [Thermoanaerobaculia bacterium]|nr:sigma-E factor regulatory protein RseB domain-containing protein [Thermoanaerobaculia bacterium]